MKKIAIVLIVLSIGACSSENEEELFGDKDSAGEPLPAVVSLSTDIVPIMDAKCAIPGCHVAGNTFPNLSVKSVIISQADRVKVRTRVGGGMPRTGSITNFQRDLIAKWVDDGAQDN